MRTTTIQRLRDRLSPAGRSNGCSDGTDTLPAETIPCSRDEFYHALQVERRRFVVERVAELDPGESISLGELANERAEEEAGHEVTVSSKDRKRVYIALYQSHLPKLASLGLIETKYDDGVSPTPATKAASEAIQWVDARFDFRPTDSGLYEQESIGKERDQ